MPNVLNLRKTDKNFEIRNKTATSAEILIYSAIGSSMWEDSLSAKQFSKELDALGTSVKEITVRINSPGGDVFDGITIYERLKQHPAKIKVIIDGLAASIASIIALAGDEVVIADGGFYMVHLPWTWAMGNRKDLDSTVNLLMKLEEQMINIYAKKSKKSHNEIRKWLEEETWFNSDQAIENGFADDKTSETLSIAASVIDRASAKNGWIRHAPKNVRTDAAAVKSAVKDLKKNIEDFLKARK